MADDESWLSKNALRLLREKWSSPFQLAQELYMIASNQPSAGVSAQSTEVQGRKPKAADHPRLEVLRGEPGKDAVAATSRTPPKTLTPATLAPMPGGMKRDTSESFVPFKRRNKQDGFPGVPEQPPIAQPGKARRDDVVSFAPTVASTSGASVGGIVSSYPAGPLTTSASTTIAAAYPTPKENRQDYVAPTPSLGDFPYPTTAFPLIDLITAPGGGGTSTFIGQLSGDSNGPVCNVVLYPDGPDNDAGDTVTVNILQLADNETVPDQTWLGSIQLLTDSSGNPAYYAQVPIWLD